MAGGNFSILITKWSGQGKHFWAGMNLAEIAGNAEKEFRNLFKWRREDGQIEPF
jgi:hypothetical protein